ncbi:MAG TPA: MarR family transcriptional regulator [Alphaproteobacteria bacterium]|nr:MarR family transcriptional regulator [Alphaproteobacteria bacterium]
MARDLKPLEVWRIALTEWVRRDVPDLSARQFAVMLSVYLTPPPHTVRGLAAKLNVSKPAITRALDRLGQLGFLKRKRDETDRRNVLVQRTVKGSVYLSDFAELVDHADLELTKLRAAQAAAAVAVNDTPAVSDAAATSGAEPVA